MLVTQQEQLHAEVTALVDRLGPGRSSLIPILQDVKRQYHGIDSDAMQIVADLLDIHPVEVYSVATFYAFLDPAARASSWCVCAARSRASWRARTPSRASSKASSASPSARPARTAASRSRGPTAWACATRGRHCSS